MFFFKIEYNTPKPKGVMKGKNTFTISEIESIKKLIIEKINETPYNQKRIRDKIRKIKFYFSDFSNKKGYTVEDFEQLINSGEIKIISDSPIINNTNEKLNQKKKQCIIKDSNSIEKFEEILTSNENFTSISNLDIKILDNTGFYCIRLKNKSKLPNRYQSILDKRKCKFIYIGKAEGQTLNERLKQELKHKKPGTFFRSIGSVLGYTPIKGHLKGKSNQNNFKFSKKDTLSIISWLEKNTDVSIVDYYDNFSVESNLIRKYNPLLNDTYNPLSLKELKEDKANCRIIARK